VRSSFSILVAMLALIAQAAPASAASVGGHFDIKVAGDPARCLAVRLVPRTPESEREFAAYFGTLGPSARQISNEALLQAPPPKGARDDVQAIGCTIGHWFTGYRFAQVAPGSYFLTALAQSSLPATLVEPGARGSGLETGPRESTVYLMRPVVVARAYQNVRLDLTED
jgi:hypothetical protein